METFEHILQKFIVILPLCTDCCQEDVEISEHLPMGMETCKFKPFSKTYIILVQFNSSESTLQVCVMCFGGKVARYE